MKYRLLIISKDQFGYLTDPFKYCEYLNDNYEITYICLDWGLEKKINTKVNVIYISNKEGYFRRFLYFIKEIKRNIQFHQFDKIFCIYFRFCAFLAMKVPQEKLVLDIRTGNVSENRIKRKISNIELWFNSLFFKNKSIISEGLAKKLRINKYDILPLGADKIISKGIKTNDKMNLLYIGTLDNRNICETIIGYKKYLLKTKDYHNSIYRIIGYGSKEEEEKIKNTIKKEGVEYNVLFLGRKDHNELVSYLGDSTIGISYIPITDYYMYQPPTKTYEYIMNGLICLGTNTIANKEIINSNNGVLCNDNSDDFCESLIYIMNNLDSYKEKEIIQTVINNSWDKIVRNYFEPIIKS